MEFTFGIVTYNSSLFILDTLESIRYQIETYSDNDTVNYLVVGDDCSKDKTIEYVKTWIKKYKKLFKECKIVQTEKNSGVVDNYSNLVRNIHTDYFKIIAGDDIFASRNIYECALKSDNGNMNIYSTIRFKDNKTYVIENDYVNMFYYKNYKHTHNKDVFLMETTKPFNTPEVCLSRKYFTEDCLENISAYRMFEDDPVHLYILRNNKDMKLEYISEPYVLYRIHDASLSKGSVGVTQIMFWDDFYKFKKYIFKTTKLFRSYFIALTAVTSAFLQKHRFGIENSLNTKIEANIFNHNKKKCYENPSFNLFKENYDKMINNERAYLNKIVKEAKSFKKNYIDKEGK